MLEKQYVTSLEKGALSIASILDEKLKATSAPQVVDYVAFAVDNINANIKHAKQDKQELDLYIKEQEQIKEDISTGTAKWLSDAGVDKLEGMRTSSITTYAPTSKVKLKILDQDYWLGSNKFTEVSIDETAVKNFLLSTEIDYSEYATLEIIHEESKIKINKKRNKDD